MSRILSRFSFQPGFDYSYQKAQQNRQPSIQAKKLIQFLKSQKDKKIEDKLRQEVFFRKIEKTIDETEDSQKNFKQNLLINSSKQKISTEKNQDYFANKISPSERKKFYSPNITKQQKKNDETSEQKNSEVQFPKNLNSSLKVPLNYPPKKSTQNDRKFAQSEKEIMNTKEPNQCPQFLRKGVRTTKKLQLPKEQRKPTIQDFLITKSLGQGTFGEVFMAFHKATRSVYTIKMFKKQIIKRHELEDKFINDIKVQLKMNHPNIVKLYGFFDDPINFYMVFEFMESGNLSKFIEEKGGRLSQVQIYRKLFEINDAISYLHGRNLIHRDIKPASVLTCLNVCKLGDTEWLQQNANKHHHTTLCRELDYMAPQAFEGKEITTEFDIWGLGLIAYELLTGKKLTQGNTQKMLIRKIISLKKELIQILIPTHCSQDLRNFISSALEPVPSKRLKSNQINQMKIEKEKQLSSNLLSNRNINIQEKPVIVVQKMTESIQKSPPKAGFIFGVKKQIRNEVSTLL